MKKQSFNKSIQNTDPSSLVQTDSPDDFLYEGQGNGQTAGTKIAKGVSKRTAEFTRTDNPDDINVNFNKL